jgi:hypothetical protein
VDVPVQQAWGILTRQIGSGSVYAASRKVHSVFLTDGSAAPCSENQICYSLAKIAWGVSEIEVIALGARAGL